MLADPNAFKVTQVSGDMTWPGGRHIAVVFNFAYEMWSAGVTSGVGPMGNVLPEGVFDPNADSYGQYNAKAGMARLIAIAQRNGISASILTSGKVAEHYPDDLHQIAQAGHEIVAHGYAQDLLRPTLTEEEELTDIIRSTNLITQATQTRPSGWISPRVTSGPASHRRLMQHCYRWHGDVIDNDLPYLQGFADGEILAIPMSVEFNDLPHAMRYGRTPAQFVELFKDAVDALLSAPPETIILDVFAHGHCYGRPAAAWAIDHIMKYCAADDRVWVATRGQIADCAHAALKVRDGSQAICAERPTAGTKNG